MKLPVAWSSASPHLAAPTLLPLPTSPHSMHLTWLPPPPLPSPTSLHLVPPTSLHLPHLTSLHRPHLTSPQPAHPTSPRPPLCHPHLLHLLLTDPSFGAAPRHLPLWVQMSPLDPRLLGHGVVREGAVGWAPSENGPGPGTWRVPPCGRSPGAGQTSQPSRCAGAVQVPAERWPRPCARGRLAPAPAPWATPEV